MLQGSVPAIFVLIGFLLLTWETTMTSGEWILEIQLHNYSNPTSTRYDRFSGTYCCCDYCSSTPWPNCSPTLSELDCRTCNSQYQGHLCDLGLEICIEYSSSVDKQCITSTDTTNNILEVDFVLESSISSDDIYETISFPGEIEPTNGIVNLMISTYDREQSTATESDEFDFFLPFIKSYYFPPAKTYLSKYQTSWLTFSYRFYCIENYYGSYCTVYCKDTNDTTGHYTCDCEGSKECLPGYSDPINNCIQEFNNSAAATSNITCSNTPSTSVSTGSAVVGTVVVLVLLLALSIGVNIGVCSVLLARLFFNRKKREKHFKENTASIQIGNPSYHNDELSGIRDITNQLYTGSIDTRPRLQTIDNQYQQQTISPVRSPVKTVVPVGTIVQYEDVTVDDDDENGDKDLYDRINHNL